MKLGFMPAGCQVTYPRPWPTESRPSASAIRPTIIRTAFMLSSPICCGGNLAQFRPRVYLAQTGLIGERYELFVIAGNFAHLPGFPGGFGPLDPLARRRDEIPPDVTLAIQRCAAEKHHPRVSDGLDLSTFTLVEDHHVAVGMAFATCFNRSADNHGAALFIVGWQLECAAGFELCIDVENFHRHMYRRREPIGFTGHKPQQHAVLVQ